MKRFRKNSPEVMKLRDIKVKCLNCGTIFNKFRFGNYKEERKYCCHKCSVEHHKKIRPVGKYHYLWKGEKAVYYTKHSWIYNNFGKANKCENNKCDGKCKTFQWANISGKYYREMKDWKQLCKSCHAKYDHIKANGNKCRKGHKRDINYKSGDWCKQCRLENYQINKIKIRKQVRDRYWKDKNK